MAPVSYPAPLRGGAVIAVPAPSMGVPQALHPRLDAATAALRQRGFTVELDQHVRCGGLTPASAEERARALTAAFTRGDVVLPPWGGELAVELLDLLDWEELARLRRWFVGWSDISTLLMPLTTLTGLATMHGANLMDEPWQLPSGFCRWSELAAAPSGSPIVQHGAERFRARPWGPWSEEPLDRKRAYEQPTAWASLDGAERVAMSGRLIGGCLETMALIAGTRYGDVPGFAEFHAPEGTIVYLEVAESEPVAVARMLTSLRLAGWFRHANGVLMGRSSGPDGAELSQLEAVRRALGGLGVPVIVNADIGHRPPQMPLVNGALARVELDAGRGSVLQQLVP